MRPTLTLTNVSYRAGSEAWLRNVDLKLAPGVNVLLGATLAGKTTLLRIMAGLDRPSSGRVTMGDRDVSRTPVSERNVAMVHQQFINYPSLTVFENIASPLRVARMREAEIKARVTGLADTLQISAYLSRYPAELSGGQQQRTALARALARGAELLLLDEPLVNLDYKLREELRSELTRLFSDGGMTVVYATTEPREALQLGGRTAVLAEGRLLEQGPTAQVFRRPATLPTARAFSDPPLNVMDARFDPTSGRAHFARDIAISLPAHARARAPADLRLAIRPHDLSLGRTSTEQVEITGRVELAEISGSETYVHLTHADVALTAQAQGIHELAPHATCALYMNPGDLYGFGLDGELLFAPEWVDGAH